MRLLITGVSGLLGINLTMEAMNMHDVVGTDRGKLRSAPFQVLGVDFLRKGDRESLLDMVKPDWLINCAALADLDQCEKFPGRARTLNTDLPHDLAAACASRNIKFLHISTDAVFDGDKDGLYTEDDSPNPQSVYAKTKLEGEEAVQNANSKAIIARVNFYGWSLSNKRSLAEFFVSKLSEGKNVNGFTDVIFCPMWVNHLSQILLEMLAKDLQGLFHVVSPEAMSKYQFGVEVAKRFGLKDSLIAAQSVEASGLAAKRSHNLHLSIHKLSTVLNHEIPIFSTGLDGFYTQFQQGYPQKIRSYQQAAL